jgi:hypothetical protein
MNSVGCFSSKIYPICLFFFLSLHNKILLIENLQDRSVYIYLPPGFFRKLQILNFSKFENRAPCSPGAKSIFRIETFFSVDVNIIFLVWCINIVH